MFKIRGLASSRDRSLVLELSYKLLQVECGSLLMLLIQPHTFTAARAISVIPCPCTLKWMFVTGKHLHLGPG